MQASASLIESDIERVTRAISDAEDTRHKAFMNRPDMALIKVRAFADAS